MDRDLAKPCVKKFNGPKTRHWNSFHLKYAAPATYHQGFIWDRKKPAIGPFMTDPDGNVFLDFVSHVGSSPLGYNQPELVALMKKIQIEPDRYAGSDIISVYGDDPESCEIPTTSHLHHKVHEITKHLGFNKAFFSNSGAEAVENAIKAAYDHRKNRGYGFTFLGAFHGRTLGSLSLNRSKVVQRRYYPEIPNIVPFHYCCCKTHPCACEWTIVENKRKISQLRATLDKQIGIIDPKEVAYIILEPIQGEGGYNVPNREFMKEVQEISDQYNIPLICDEIQSGMGRTGEWWACEHYGMKPDYITAAKALRVGATIGKSSMFPESGRISSTWG
ncbi:aminotransferase class III-fold pyridoxal phosphate-dependent enzyme, partial [Candidatus Woesearchaeota archaeon]|nr:aminotransferase class III-fold pyridoxal phosphate-dependent enzyme [Candidatus Woesearchaeota archaeon]